MTAARFLPWVREGLGASIGAADPGGGQPLPARAELDVTASVSGSGGGNASVKVRVLGPADVTAIDARQVIRMEPAPSTNDLEPNYLPLVEFDRPDLPWLFTPAAASTSQQLRPWLCLVVVERDTEASIETPPDRLPVLKLKDAGKALPGLAESWAWVHAQIAGEGDPAAILRSPDGSRTLSRLLCPRRLTGRTAYIAAVVPAFEQGRLAGLGRLEATADSASQLQPAWTGATGALELPAYHHWEFATGAEGDFEALVSSLQRVALEPAQVGHRPMTVEGLPAGLPDLGEVSFHGALGLPGEPEEPVEGSFHTALRTLLSAQPPIAPGTAPPGLALAPPLYGRWQAARASIPATGGPTWLRELNLHPVNRGAAGIGTQIVIDEQEQLMAAAWAQVEDILRANQLLRQAQLARAAASTLHAQLSALPPAQLVLLARPVASRLVHGERTIAAIIAASRVPEAMLGPAFRRALRPGGPLARRASTLAVRLLEKVNAGTLPVVAQRTPPPETVLFDDVHDGDPVCTLKQRIRDQPVGTGDVFHSRLKEAALAQLQTMPPCDPREPPARPPLDLDGLCTTIRSALDPEVTIPARMRDRISRPAGWSPEDELEPVMVAPRFPTPMYRALAARSQDLLLPGVGEVPPNSVAALSTNPRFVAAFMLGLNHEMSRELLWRRFPTDQRGTYFQQFWDPAGRVPAPTSDAARHDHPAIHEWEPGLELGGHIRGGRQFVLLIRGDLLRRYPNTAIYLARGEWYVDETGLSRRRPIAPTMPPTHTDFPERYPQFTGTLEPDITFIGFDVPPDDAVGSTNPAEKKPGWFVILQQQATELRFGLDATAPDPGKLTGTWRDLWWGHVALTASRHIDLSKPLTGVTVTNTAGLEWGKTSTHLAAITTQQPFRAAIHASDLLPSS